MVRQIMRNNLLVPQYQRIPSFRSQHTDVPRTNFIYTLSEWCLYTNYKLKRLPVFLLDIKDTKVFSKHVLTVLSNKAGILKSGSFKTSL